MDNKDFLGKIIKVIIDRPFGTKHPKHGYISRKLWICAKYNKWGW